MRTPSTKHIYKYIFRSNSGGLAPLGPARPDKSINLATLGPSAFASRGINCTTFLTMSKIAVTSLGTVHLLWDRGGCWDLGVGHAKKKNDF